MRWKVLGAASALLAAGLVGGYVVGGVRADDPAAIPTAAPVPAESPAAPTAAPVVCATDPDVAPLPVDLTAAPDLVSSGARHGYALTLDVPVGWAQARTDQGQWKWAPDGAPLNIYGMRATIVAAQHQSVDVVEQTRVSALRSAVREGNLADFAVESDGDDTFVATYTDRGFCRLTMERVLALGSTSAYVDLAVTGRLGDREGLMDLLARTTASLRAG